MRSNQESKKEIKTYLFSYEYENSKWSLEISAYSEEDAIQIIQNMSQAEYDGELQQKIMVPSNN